MRQRVRLQVCHSDVLPALRCWAKRAGGRSAARSRAPAPAGQSGEGPAAGRAGPEPSGAGACQRPAPGRQGADPDPRLWLQRPRRGHSRGGAGAPVLFAADRPDRSRDLRRRLREPHRPGPPTAPALSLSGSPCRSEPEESRHYRGVAGPGLPAGQNPSPPLFWSSPCVPTIGLSMPCGPST